MQTHTAHCFNIQDIMLHNVAIYNSDKKPLFLFLNTWLRTDFHEVYIWFLMFHTRIWTWRCTMWALVPPNRTPMHKPANAPTHWSAKRPMFCLALLVAPSSHCVPLLILSLSFSFSPPHLWWRLWWNWWQWAPSSTSRRAGTSSTLSSCPSPSWSWAWPTSPVYPSSDLSDWWAKIKP